MAKKEFTYKGMSVDELKTLSAKEFAKVTTSRIRRSIERGLRPSQEAFMEKLRKSTGKTIKTHCRDMVILPEMIDRTIKVYNGKEFKELLIRPEMVGHVLGEFSLSRNRVAHSSPGVGASRSSATQGKK